MKQRVRQFVFSGLLARHSVKEMEAGGLLRIKDGSVSEKKDQDLFASVQEQIRAGSLQMQRVYRILYVLENMIREMIDFTFTELDKTPDWFETRANSDMKRKYEERKLREEKNNWHSGRNKQPIFYLDFGDLSRLIVNHWTAFSDLLPTQNWAQSRLDEAERTRNVIAHTNILPSDEIDRLEMYLRDWIKQIG
jgi:hypothetical protein